LMSRNNFPLAYRKIRGLASEKISASQTDLQRATCFTGQGLASLRVQAVFMRSQSLSALSYDI
jgi:hypothetical protein